jgi:Toluene-4-monooxygenase system protein B (TmoB)
MIPLYAFVEGDTLGLLILAEETETIESLAKKALSAASVRVAPRTGPTVLHRGAPLDPRITVALAGLSPLSRVDVRYLKEAR